MRYLALACDYDNTLAYQGHVDDQTVAALARLRATGRQLLLVTGRILADLQRVFPRIDLFDIVVAENGALLYLPGPRTVRPLGPPPPEAFVAALREQDVPDLTVGRVIVSTKRPGDAVVQAAIRKLDLDLRVIFNKNDVMVLPPDLDKSTGIQVALRELELSPHSIVAVGDAENDQALLHACACGAAVGNALPMLKEQADLVLTGEYGAGVVELIDRLIATDLQEVSLRREQPGDPSAD
jgi:hypothetical protein